MTASPGRTFGETLNTWVQTIGIIGAAGWGAYTFVYKEITVPKSAPINISINLQLKKIGPKSGASSKENLIAVELQTAATNPSPRKVYLLQSAWVAIGCKIDIGPDEAQFTSQAYSALNSSHEAYAELFSAHTACSNVAAGHLFADEGLKPNESIHRSIIVYVPSSKYDELNVVVRLPSTEKRERGIKLKWTLEKGGLRETPYHVRKNGELTEFSKDENGNYYDKDFAKLGMQEAYAQASLSLWQEVK